MIRLFVIATTLASFQFGHAQCPAIDSPAGDPPDTKINLVAKQVPSRTGSPLWVEIIMTNPGDHDISFWKSTNTNTYPIEVSDEAGKPLPDKRPGFRHDFTRPQASRSQTTGKR